MNISIKLSIILLDLDNEYYACNLNDGSERPLEKIYEEELEKLKKDTELMSEQEFQSSYAFRQAILSKLYESQTLKSIDL